MDFLTDPPLWIFPGAHDCQSNKTIRVVPVLPQQPLYVVWHIWLCGAVHEICANTEMGN